MPGAEGFTLPSFLAIADGEAADAAQIAEKMAETWQQIDAALSPIVGQRGVAALYARSLQVTARLHPWLAGQPDAAIVAMNLAGMKSAMAQQSGAEAAAGGAALLANFHDLLAGLVGPSLTERLLRSVWANFTRGPPAQDTST